MALSPESSTAKEVLHAFGTNPESGLTEDEAAARLVKNGRNILAPKKSISPFLRLLTQFNDPMIYILLAAAVISILLGEIADSIIILFVVVLNGIIGYIQEARAEKAIDALKKMSSPRAAVRRGGKVCEIDAAELVCGDIVLLEAGRVVPADLRLIESSNLKIEESALTGESEPAEKNSTFIAHGETMIGDRANMAFMTTPVTYGRGAGVVTAVGMDTEIGRIAKILEEPRQAMTPLQKRLADLGKLLGIVAVALCIILFLVAVLQKRNIFEMLLTAITLAVAAIPEGLPAVVTIVLAIGAQRMVKSRTIVRRLPSVETLGSVNVVCSDKTGTLTQNRMTAVRCYFEGKTSTPRELDAKSAAIFFEGFTLCNDAAIEGGRAVGDPTETALLDMSDYFSISRSALEKQKPRINELPFDSQRKMMTTVHDCGDRKISYTKGALDVILKHTKTIWNGGSLCPMTEENKEKILFAASEMSANALRVLALAFRESGEEVLEEELCFIGLVGMIDPPRPEVKEAVNSCRRAGITTVMITGDHKDTALAVARDIGIADGAEQCISGEELDQMTQEQLSAKVKNLRVFARVSPEHKVMIVRAFKADGSIVSMTGDGVNDAPSLRAADIGIAMGITGTDVAKGAADMILTDDNFATIKKAIEEGRNIYNNIKKSAIYLLSSNIGEILVMFLGVIVGLPAPLSPVDILWVNLVTDSLPALALSADPGTPDVMNEKPRDSKESLFAHGGITALIVYGIIIGGSTLFSFLLGCHEAAPISSVFSFSNINFGLKNVVAQGRTFALTVLSISQLFHAIGMRNTQKSIFRMNHLNNKLMWVSVGLGIVLQVVIVQSPLSHVFSTTPLTLSQWVTLILISALPLAAHEIIVFIAFIRANHS
jgi:Ca2+-transporting ATPase